MAATRGAIRVGVGGWTFEPWRGTFFPESLAQKRELEFASRALTSIEINGTYYGSQKPASFAKWRDETPDDFVFSVKGPRFATNRKVLAESGSSIGRFVEGGVLELGQKLGPINWQFLPTKAFVADDFEAFLALLPQNANGRKLRHVVEVRHPSFLDPAFPPLLRKYSVATVFTDKDAFPQIADVTTDFAYLRLQKCSPDVETGYEPAALTEWAERVRLLAAGTMPKGVPVIGDGKPKAGSHDVFVYFINGHKPKAPAAATALLKVLG